MLMIYVGIILNGCVFVMLMRLLELLRRKRVKIKVRVKIMIDCVKERVIVNCKCCNELELSVQVVESFVKLQEVKRLCEERLKDDDFDIMLMLSVYFVKICDSDIYKYLFLEVGESYCGSLVVDIFKIIFVGVDNKELLLLELFRFDRLEERFGLMVIIEEKLLKEEEVVKKVVDDVNIFNGVYSYEVELFIENGYVKVVFFNCNYLFVVRLWIGLQNNVDKKDYFRFLYRKDIFYSGSMFKIFEFMFQFDMYSYIISIIMIFGELVFLFFFIWDYCMCLLKFIVDIF